MTKTERERIDQLAGLTGEDGGFLAPAFPASGLWVPGKIRIEGDWLVYDRAGGHLREAGRDLLTQFRRLATGFSSERVLRFARAWGVLNICVHDVSMYSQHFVEPTVGGHLFCRPRFHGSAEGRIWPQGEFSEPLLQWDLYTREADALYHSFARLELGRALDRRHARMLWWDQADEVMARSLEEQRSQLAGTMTVSLLGAAVRPWLSWEGGRRVGLVWYDGVLGAAWAQLYAIVGSSYAVCSGCGRRFRPTQLPRTGDRTWCSREECRLRRSAAASRDYRERRKTAEERVRSGEREEEVARALGRPVKQIKKWARSVAPEASRRRLNRA